MRFYEFAQKLDELERGGNLSDDDFVGDLHKGDYSDAQMDLFKEIPAGVPNVPNNFKIIGRMGELFVARQTNDPKNVETYVWFNRTKAVSCVVMAPYDPQMANYPRHVPSEIPHLNGRGLRVHKVIVLKEFKGKNLGPLMYQWLLTNVLDYIIADDTHTEGGVMLWKKLQKMKNIFSVHVWNDESYEHEKRRPGNSFNVVYNKMHLVPWVTLVSKEAFVFSSDD